MSDHERNKSLRGSLLKNRRLMPLDKEKVISMRKSQEKEVGKEKQNGTGNGVNADEKKGRSKKKVRVRRRCFIRVGAPTPQVDK